MQIKLSKNFQKGFTVIELLMVASLVAVLASLLIVTINPVSHFAESKNALRWSNVNSLLNAVYQYEFDNKGAPPQGVDATPREICNVDTDKTLCTANGLIDLSLLVPKYIRAIPLDPVATGANGSGYQISKDAEGKVTIRALYAENADTISVSR